MISTRRCIIGILTGMLSVSVVGCSPAPGGGPANPTVTSSTVRLPSSPPRVPRSLDASTYRDKPCALFTDEQARVLGYLKPGSPYMEPDSADCQRISTPMGDADLTINYYFSTNLLEKIYRRETTSWPSNSLVPLTIVGQPALRTTFPTTELCRVALGLTDNQAVEIRVDDKHINSCDRAVQVAETIVHNLGG